MAKPEPDREVVIITGLSGAGRRTAAHALEDLGWYVVDNLPHDLIPRLSDRLLVSQIVRVGVVVDVRSRQHFEMLPETIEALQSRGVRVTVMYLEATDEIIVRRQESTRRPLPLQGDDRLTEGIVRERRALANIRAAADIVIDTSNISARQLGQRIANHFADELGNRFRIALISFGFKHGLPMDADMVFDVRFLPNPYWVPDLRAKTGLSADVADFVLRQSGVDAFLEHSVQLLQTASPGYQREGKLQATVAIGCTGGKHRSTALGEELASRLHDLGYAATILHRDIGKE
ncbi:MAG: RNase adapter RapZ [Arachnia propionica]|nr:MAG: RNase adapter RapZ [Arachnia propionica]